MSRMICSECFEIVAKCKQCDKPLQEKEQIVCDTGYGHYCLSCKQVDPNAEVLEMD